MLLLPCYVCHHFSSTHPTISPHLCLFGCPARHLPCALPPLLLFCAPPPFPPCAPTCTSPALCSAAPAGSPALCGQQLPCAGPGQVPLISSWRKNTRVAGIGEPRAWGGRMVEYRTGELGAECRVVGCRTAGVVGCRTILIMRLHGRCAGYPFEDQV